MIEGIVGQPHRFLIEYLADPEPDADAWGSDADGTALAIVNPGKHGSDALIMLAPSSPVTGLTSLLAGASTRGRRCRIRDGGASCRSERAAARDRRRPDRSHVDARRAECLDDSPFEVGGPTHVAHWHDWLRWSNVQQFVTRPRLGHDLPMRMAEIWTRRSDDPFAGAAIPLAGPVPGKTADAAIELTPEWSLVRDYTDPALAQLIAIMDRGGVDVPEVGPDESVWQVELAWPDTKVAVVVDTDADRDRWLEEHGWTVASAEGAFEPDTLAREIEDAVKGSTQ